MASKEIVLSVCITCKDNKESIFKTRGGKRLSEKVLSKIKKLLQLNSISTDVALLSTPRQAVALKICAENKARAKDLFAVSTIELELISFELRGAIEALDALLGKTTPEDIINNIFKTLCVGK